MSVHTNLSGNEAPAQDNTDPIGSSTSPLSRSPSAQVGYGKPPAQHRFRPGQSGNPAGRPKKATSVAAVFEQELETSVRTAGRRLSRREAMLHAGVDKALTGDIFAIGRVGKWLEKYELLTPSSSGFTGGVVRVPGGYSDASEQEQSRMLDQAIADAQKWHSTSGAGWRSSITLNTKAALSGILAQRTVTDVDGVSTSMTKREALMNILTCTAAAGNGRATDLVVNLQNKIARAEQEQQKHGGRGIILLEEPCKTQEEWEATFGAAALARRAGAINNENCS